LVDPARRTLNWSAAEACLWRRDDASVDRRMTRLARASAALQAVGMPWQSEKLPPTVRAWVDAPDDGDHGAPDSLDTLVTTAAETHRQNYAFLRQTLTTFAAPSTLCVLCVERSARGADGRGG
jgi:hypothetical protein